MQEDIEESAAVKIQAVYRGRIARLALAREGRLPGQFTSSRTAVATSDFAAEINVGDQKQVSLTNGDVCDIWESVDEHWYYGRNKRTNDVGFLPVAYLADQTEAEITGHSKSSEPSTGMKANPASKAPPAAAPERWRPKFEVQTQEMVAVKMQAAYRGWATRRALIAAGKLHHFADTLVSTIAITSYRPQVRDKATYQEVALNCGDACDIAHSVNEHWCFGRNRRTGFIGFIPATYLSDCCGRHDLRIDEEEATDRRTAIQILAALESLKLNTDSDTLQIPDSPPNPPEPTSDELAQEERRCTSKSYKIRFQFRGLRENLSKNMEFGSSAEALHAYKGRTMKELTFVEGERIEILEKVNDTWYLGRSADGTRCGFVPTSFITMVASTRFLRAFRPWISPNSSGEPFIDQQQKVEHGPFAAVAADDKITNVDGMGCLPDATFTASTTADTNSTTNPSENDVLQRRRLIAIRQLTTAPTESETWQTVLDNADSEVTKSIITEKDEAEMKETVASKFNPSFPSAKSDAESVDSDRDANKTDIELPNLQETSFDELSIGSPWFLIGQDRGVVQTVVQLIMSIGDVGDFVVRDKKEGGFALSVRGSDGRLVTFIIGRSTERGRWSVYGTSGEEFSTLYSLVGFYAEECRESLGVQLSMSAQVKDAIKTAVEDAISAHASEIAFREGEIALGAALIYALVGSGKNGDPSGSGEAKPRNVWNTIVSPEFGLGLSVKSQTLLKQRFLRTGLLPDAINSDTNNETGTIKYLELASRLFRMLITEDEATKEQVCHTADYPSAMQWAILRRSNDDKTGVFWFNKCTGVRKAADDVPPAVIAGLAAAAKAQEITRLAKMSRKVRAETAAIQNQLTEAKLAHNAAVKRREARPLPPELLEMRTKTDELNKKTAACKVELEKEQEKAKVLNTAGKLENAKIALNRAKVLVLQQRVESAEKLKMHAAKKAEVVEEQFTLDIQMSQVQTKLENMRAKVELARARQKQARLDRADVEATHAELLSHSEATNAAFKAETEATAVLQLRSLKAEHAAVRNKTTIVCRQNFNMVQNADHEDTQIAKLEAKVSEHTAAERSASTRLHETKKKLADVDAALSRASEEVKALERDDIEGVTRLKNLLEETYQKTREKRLLRLMPSLRGSNKSVPMADVVQNAMSRKGLWPEWFA